MPNDLLAGRVEQLAIGFAPQSNSGSFAYYIHSEMVNQLTQ